MSWRLLFIIGIVLTLSPFHIKWNGFVFLYSLLGYGLIFVSYFYKKIRKFDIIPMILIGCIIVTGILNLFYLAALFQLGFYLAVAVYFYLFVDNELSTGLAVTLIGFIGFLLPVQLANGFGSPLLRNLLFITGYAFPFFMTALFWTSWNTLNEQDGPPVKL